jgi:hypothetical protein
MREEHIMYVYIHIFCVPEFVNGFFYKKTFLN